jgi:hypothetical protein
MESKESGTVFVMCGAVLISFSAISVKLAHVSPIASGAYRNLTGALVRSGINI